MIALDNLEMELPKSVLDAIHEHGLNVVAVQAVCEYADDNPRYHIVEYGDTLYQIAMDNDMSVSELLSKNPQIENANMIHVGDKIYL